MLAKPEFVTVYEVLLSDSDMDGGKDTKKAKRLKT